MILQLLSLLVVLAYGVCLVVCWISWRRIPTVETGQDVPTVFFSVIIPVRNEATHIVQLLGDLERQQYPASAFEVIVVDDHSEDDTVRQVEQFQQQTQLRLSVLNLASFPGVRQKKGAVEAGIKAAKGEWIACTDGDCRLHPSWLALLNQLKQRENPKIICGPVALSPCQNLFQNLQALEFSALIGVGAATLQMGRPTMCNGANLAYEKDAFYGVNGFKGNEHVPSGDDEFLLHKIQQKYPKRAVFLKAENAVVKTAPASRLSQFIHQRVRWASKWQHYEAWGPKVLAVLVAGANLLLWFAFFMAVANIWSWWFFALCLLVKLGPDLLLFSSVLPFFQKNRLFSLIPLLQVVYVPYVLYTALSGLKGRYRWKGREHESS
ncbi:glycosyltransferase [Rufibacter ruber]|uniref:glycosyltransferase n=1 Tax=Rufibacter ruber TaxID=1783499 RepID=UPI000B2CC9D8|nr:glycosyltransferase [Rufibacter ruber]